MYLKTFYPINTLFFALFNILQNIMSTNTIHLLAHNAFNYQITFADGTIVLIDFMSYSFTILTN